MTITKIGAYSAQAATDRPADVSYGNPTDAARIRELLSRAGLTQRGAARELGVDERTMRYWCAEDGRNKPPRMAILALERLADLQRQVAQPRSDR